MRRLSPPSRPTAKRANTRRAATRSKPDAALDDAFQYMDIAPAFREQVSRYGPDRLALPCGGSALVLVYRRDAFERTPNKQAAEQAGAVVSSRRRPGNNSTRLQSFSTAATGAAMASPMPESPWHSAPTPRVSATRRFWRGPPAWASIVTITRFFSIPTRRAPRIDSPPFAQALR